jgi:hypothetical protein
MQEAWCAALLARISYLKSLDSFAMKIESGTMFLNNSFQAVAVGSTGRSRSLPSAIALTPMQASPSISKYINPRPMPATIPSSFC